LALCSGVPKCFRAFDTLLNWNLLLNMSCRTRGDSLLYRWLLNVPDMHFGQIFVSQFK
jgi:hypothetical protein